MVLGHMVLCTHGFLAHGIAYNGAYKSWEDFIVMQGLEVSDEDSLGQIGQGFWPMVNEISLVGFFPGFGVFPDKHLCLC